MKKKKIFPYQGEVKPTTSYTNSFDFILLLSVICLLIIGLAALLSVTWHTGRMVLFKKQALFVVLGLIFLYLSQKLNYQIYKAVGLFLYLFSVLLLCVVLIPGIGITIGGVQKWLRFFSVTFSPNIIAQISLILYLSRVLSADPDETNKHNFRFMVYPILLIPIALMLRQPTLTEPALYLCVGTLIMFLAGARIFYLYLAGAALLPFLYVFLAYPYRVKRLVNFLNPFEDPHGTGYQVIQSLIALGSGGFSGVGFGKGIQKHFYLPESHSSFILSNFGEEFGLLGVLFVIIVFFIFLLRGFKVSLQVHDPFGRLVAAGITIWIGSQAIANIGLVYGLMPTHGTSLPFLSYGGTGIIVQLFAVGVLLNISFQTGKYTNHWGIPRTLIKQFARNLPKKIQSISIRLEPHPLYRLSAFLALILTIIVCILQLIFWFLLKK